MGGGTLGSDARTFSQGMQRSPSLGGSYPIGKGQDTVRMSNMSMQNLAGGSATLGPSAPNAFYSGRTRAASFSSLGDVVDGPNHALRFIRDTSRLWHKDNMTREEATAYLLDKPPGWFVVRNSNTYPGAYGLAVKVAQVPPNVQLRRGDPQADLVRHFLIEPTSRGVQLKGNSIEPVFATLAALVYQHTLTPLALPLKLILPDFNDFGLDTMDSTLTASGSHLSSVYAAFNVLYINSVDLESLTGPEAVSRAIDRTFGSASGPPDAVEVNLKVSALGITLTDNRRRLFFRRHYPINAVTYCGLDNQDRRWNFTSESGSTVSISRVFGFVARKQGSATDNVCHLFAELDPTHSSPAIVNVLSNAMTGQGIFARN